MRYIIQFMRGHQLYLGLWVGVLIMTLIWTISVMAEEIKVAQVRISPTPVQFSIATDAAPLLPTDVAISTPTPTRTPTSIPPVMIRAINPDTATQVNVRAEPDPGGERLGALEPDVTYVVLGRYFSWIQFEYQASPTGRAWVFETLVEVIGDENRIQQVDPFVAPTVSSDNLRLTQTFEALINRPGAAETATADARIIALPTSVGGGPNRPSLGQAGPGLPTFTPPPDILVLPPTPQFNVQPSPTPEPDVLQNTIGLITSGGLPPIVPIVLLIGFGVLGVVVSLVRSSLGR